MNMMNKDKKNLCVLCGKAITSNELIVSQSTHLLCQIEYEGGCYNERGDFLSCHECYNSCCFRQCLPREFDADYQIQTAIEAERRKKRALWKSELRKQSKNSLIEERMALLTNPKYFVSSNVACKDSGKDAVDTCKDAVNTLVLHT